MVFEGKGSDQIWFHSSPTTTSSISVTNTSIPVQSEKKLMRAESNLNSLECWDYSVELECLQGPDGSKMFELLPARPSF